MIVAIVTNLNGIGLQRDFELISDFLTDRGHTVTGIQYDAPPDDAAFLELTSKKYDLAIFLELVPRHLLNLASVKWAWLNPEWVKPEMIRLIDRNIDKVFAKTHEAFRLFSPLWPSRTHYTGFMARDQYLSNASRFPWFLHIGGNSSIRGTQAVVDAWRWKKNGKALDARLFIVSSVLQDRPEIPKVTYFDRAAEDALKVLQNECLFHIYPAATEGFGHAIHEALGVDAFVISTDAPPMSEFGAALRLPARKAGRYNLADLYEVSALDIYDAVQNILSLYPDQIESDSRKLFLEENQIFRDNLDVHLADIRPHQARTASASRAMNRIAFLGNFLTPDSTESMVQWALEERLGVEVEPLQENKVNLRMLEEAMEWNDIFLWIHTRNFFQVPDNAMLMFLEDLRRRHIPTVSMHLDKFWGIPEREKRIGVDPFWKTDFVFTADGSRQADFGTRGVRHFWMKPAMSEVYCHPGVPREEFRCDVGFVGAKGYHAEYPFRPRLVDWLEETYGGRFKHITDVRGHALNDFYASCKVVVGDCIFSGTPRYWSDRVPETCGRFGFLLHPKVEGLPGYMSFYEPQNLESLQWQIEYWLARDEVRRFNAMAVAESTHRYDTWTVRMREILKIVRGENDAKVHEN
jgi:hypothetical protein